MMSVSPVVIFWSFLCSSLAVKYLPDATAGNADFYGIKLPEPQNTTKVCDFLQAYISHRSAAEGWKTLMTPWSSSLYYACFVKLTDKGNESSAIKKSKTIIEYLRVRGTTSPIPNIHFASVPGLVFTQSTTPYTDDYYVHAESGLVGYVSILDNDNIKKKLPSLKLKKADLQVAVSIVIGSYYGKDVGEFLLVAGYAE